MLLKKFWVFKMGQGCFALYQSNCFWLGMFVAIGNSVPIRSIFESVVTWVSHSQLLLSDWDPHLSDSLSNLPKSKKLASLLVLVITKSSANVLAIANYQKIYFVMVIKVPIIKEAKYSENSQHSAVNLKMWPFFSISTNLWLLRIEIDQPRQE